MLKRIEILYVVNKYYLYVNHILFDNFKCRKKWKFYKVFIITQSIYHINCTTVYVFSVIYPQTEDDGSKTACDAAD